MKNFSDRLFFFFFVYGPFVFFFVKLHPSRLILENCRWRVQILQQTQVITEAKRFVGSAPLKHLLLCGLILF